MKRFHNFRQSGFTIIELMVGVTIALLTVLVITQVFVIANHRTRDIAGGNDAQQSAAIAGYFLSSAIRQAGSNIHDTSVEGCLIYGGGKSADGKSGMALPVDSAATIPSFFRIPSQAVVRAAPVVISTASESNQDWSRASDVLQVISGSSQAAASGFSFSLSGNEMAVKNSNGITAGDYLLVAPAVTGGNCALLRVGALFNPNPGNTNPIADTPQVIPLDETFGRGFSAIPSLAAPTMFSLGKAPRFYLFGVNTLEQTLDMYDYLKGMLASVAITDNVFLLRALYGVDSDNDGTLQWVSPRSSGWTFGELQSWGGSTNIANIKAVRAIRLALITRSRYPSGEAAPENITLFSSLDESLQQTLKLTTAERRYRYQVYETVVPLFNNTF